MPALQLQSKLPIVFLQTAFLLKYIQVKIHVRVGRVCRGQLTTSMMNTIGVCQTFHHNIQEGDVSNPNPARNHFSLPSPQKSFYNSININFIYSQE